MRRRNPENCASLYPVLVVVSAWLWTNQRPCSCVVASWDIMTPFTIHWFPVCIFAFEQSSLASGHYEDFSTNNITPFDMHPLGRTHTAATTFQLD